jgi:hypothetical protein
MPYSSTADLPANVRALSPKSQRQWMHIWNSAYSRCVNGGTNDRDDCESRAFAQANGVVLKSPGKARHRMDEPQEQDDWLSDEDVAFKKLSYQQRKNLPKSAYAYTDAQGKGHLPIHDLPHLRNAISRLGQAKTGAKWGLTGEAKQRLMGRLRSKLARVQHAFDQHYAHGLATFDLGPDAANKTLVSIPQDQDIVIRRGPIFHTGKYPDKNFSLTAKELKRVVKEFAGPLAVDSEHERSIFDGKLGHLLSVEASADGKQLLGTVAVPKWLDPILMAAGGKVSAAFDRTSKKLVGLALTINPRVSDAALMAAFSVDQVTKGALGMDELIAMAGGGKLAKKKAKLQAKADKLRAKSKDDDDDDDDDADDKNGNGNGAARHNGQYDRMIPQGGRAGQSGGASVAAMATRGGRNMMQKIHDITASRGAVCRVEPQPATEIGPYGIVRYASKAEMNVVQAIHDTTLQNGASCTPTLYGQRDVPGGSDWTWQYPGVKDEGRAAMPGGTKAPHFNDNSKAMKNFRKLVASLSEQEATYESPDTTPVTMAAPSSHDEEVARLRDENRRMKMQNILERATTFADKMISDGHAVPVEREGMIAVHAQLEHDDAFSSTATFSNGMSRVAVYEASIQARPNNLLQSELLPSAVQAGLIKFANLTETPNRGIEQAPSPERVRQLANLDPVLKKAYEATHGTNGTGH